jgi:hypothetical protein
MVGWLDVSPSYVFSFAMGRERDSSTTRGVREGSLSGWMYCSRKYGGWLYLYTSCLVCCVSSRRFVLRMDRTCTSITNVESTQSRTSGNPLQTSQLNCSTVATTSQSNRSTDIGLDSSNHLTRSLMRPSRHRHLLEMICRKVWIFFLTLILQSTNHQSIMGP